MLELVIRDASDQNDVPCPRVDKLEGPRVRLTISPDQSLAMAIDHCRSDLHEAVEWAITEIYMSDEAPGRVFVRDANEATVMIDPCAVYGLQAIVRAKNL